LKEVNIVLLYVLYYSVMGQEEESTRWGGPAWRKTSKQNSFCVRVVWQTQNTVKHLVQTKKIRC